MLRTIELCAVVHGRRDASIHVRRIHKDIEWTRYYSWNRWLAGDITLTTPWICIIRIRTMLTKRWYVNPFYAPTRGSFRIEKHSLCTVLYCSAALFANDVSENISYRILSIILANTKIRWRVILLNWKKRNE